MSRDGSSARWIAAAVALAGVFAFGAMYLSWQKSVDRVPGAAGSAPPSAAAAGSGSSFLQLPHIDARFEADHVFVTLRNDTTDLPVPIDPTTDQLILEYATTVGGSVSRVTQPIPPQLGRTLAPGQSLAPLRIALPSHQGTVSITFEKQLPNLVVTTEATFP